MGVKLLWTSIAIFLIAPVFAVPAANIVAAVIAFLGCLLMWLDK